MANPELVVAIVALVVSLVALLATFMQVLQQYYASAAGYSNCNEKVMGGWAKTKTRRFSWKELRYEVQYDAPVIFVSPPSNKRGPIREDDKIYFLDGTKKSLEETWTTSDPDPRVVYLQLSDKARVDGTKKSLEETWTTSDPDPRAAYLQPSDKARVHTADNERASWLVLLYAVQRMEGESRRWQEGQYSRAPPGAPAARYSLSRTPPTLREHHTLTVALQRKRKSWDTMPTSMTKPYATTTMCHMIEMLAALGVYWKQFDRRHDRYWAEGNGYLVLGERVSDLGIVFTLQVHGRCTFERNRVIPVDYVKELTFGYVPTIYRDTIDQSRLEVPSDLPENLSSLLMGNDREIAESLTVLGCNTNAVNYFLETGKRTSHIFPLAFEMLGMLSQNFHINGSSFTYIPNPTAYCFDKRSFSLPKLMHAFKLHFTTEYNTTRNHIIADTIQHHVDEVLTNYSEKDGASRLLCLHILHTAIDDTDEILTAKRKDPADSPSKSPNASQGCVPIVVSADQGETSVQGKRREMVQDVLRSHIQEVLRLLNERDDRGAELQPPQGNMSARSPVSPLQTKFIERDGALRPSPPPPSFEDVDDASPDDRQHQLMEIYFGVVRRRVVPRATLSTGRRASLGGGGRPQSLPSLRGGSRGISPARSLADRPGSSRASSSAAAGHIADDAPPVVLSGDDRSDADVAAISDAGDGEDVGGGGVEDAAAVNLATDRRARSGIPLSAQPASHDDIWCTLVFRMICWLMLHDMNKLDVQLSKSELLGSRVPVYIA